MHCSHYLAQGVMIDDIIDIIEWCNIQAQEGSKIEDSAGPHDKANANANAKAKNGFISRELPLDPHHKGSGQVAIPSLYDPMRTGLITMSDRFTFVHYFTENHHFDAKYYIDDEYIHAHHSHPTTC